MARVGGCASVAIRRVFTDWAGCKKLDKLLGDPRSFTFANELVCSDAKPSCRYPPKEGTAKQFECTAITNGNERMLFYETPFQHLVVAPYQL